MEKEVNVFIIENGPIKIEGEINLILQDGVVLEPKGTTFLCRCGYSNNKPFCDGQHRQKNFQD